MEFVGWLGRACVALAHRDGRVPLRPRVATAESAVRSAHRSRVRAVADAFHTKECVEASAAANFRKAAAALRAVTRRHVASPGRQASTSSVTRPVYCDAAAAVTQRAAAAIPRACAMLRCRQAEMSTRLRTASTIAGNAADTASTPGTDQAGTVCISDPTCRIKVN